MLAVEFHRAVVLAAPGVARALERAHRAVFKDRQEHAGVVDIDLLYRAGIGMLAFLDERLFHAGYFVDLADEVAGEVCDVLQIPAFLARQTDLLAAAAAACVRYQSR